MDPRLQVPAAGLVQQFTLSQTLYDLRARLQPIGKSFDALVAAIAKRKAAAKGKETQDALDGLLKKLEPLADPAAMRSGRPLEWAGLGKNVHFFGDLQRFDAAPTPVQERAVTELQSAAASVPELWKTIPDAVATVNAQLQKAGLESIKLL